jgi:hypothetical protein
MIMPEKMDIQFSDDFETMMMDWGGHKFSLNSYDFEMMKNLDAAVQRGVEYLDERIPDWYLQIDMDNINIASGYTCICGQLFASKLEETYLNYRPTHGFDYALRYFLLQDANGDDGNFWSEDYIEAQEMASYLGFNLPKEVLNSEELTEDEFNATTFAKCSFMTNMTAQYEYLALEWIKHIEKRIANDGKVL